MNDESNIFFINSHAKRNRRNYHQSPIAHPICLNLISFVRRHISVVELNFEASFLTHSRQVLAILPFIAVN